MNQKINILNTKIFDTSYKDIVSFLKNKIEKREKVTFHNVNVNILLICSKSEEFKKNLESFTFLFSDGTGVYWASKMLYGKNGLKERIMGTDLYYHILELANKNKYKCFFFGGSEKAVNQLPDILKSKYSDLIVTGILSRETEFREETVKKIKDSGAEILFVGLGTPYQEEWIKKFSDSIDIPVQIAVGSGIEFLSGANKRAPLVLRKIGLEWVHRIYSEPGRLWKRYVFGIPIFMFKIFKLKVKLLVNKQVNSL